MTSTIPPAGDESPTTPRRRIRIRPIEKHPPAAEAAPSLQPIEEQEAGPASRAKREGPNWREDGSYIIGKGRPPVGARWTKGQSGNPRGKKKGTRNADTLLIEMMEADIAVKTANGETRMSRNAALNQRLFEMAAKGNLGAARLLLERYAQAIARRGDTDATSDQLSDDERTMVTNLVAALGFGKDTPAADAQETGL